ncbi:MULTISPECIES: DUF192 domain-containing protein [Halorussus]|uniref:DUF192 domain-containing protein n=1 Tax=Halorussus TaxID=1070314 RepID=UPI000E219879|nr:MULTISPECIES: DUF192 domain-containing protein [Halorussus]NHN58965.1 hypothetical protein [Halorussus sp. JP-T4]
MTTESGEVFAVAVPVIVALSLVAAGALAPAAGQPSDAVGVQGAEADLQLAANGSSVIVPGQNVTANFTLTNTGDGPSTAPVVELANVPGGWEVVTQSAGPNVTWSETNTAWASTESLAPGESLNVSVTLRLPNETAQSVYHVSARAFDAGGSVATAVEEFPVGSFGDEAPLSLSASGPESVRPGENVTVELSLANEGENETVAPVVSLAGVPSNWTVLNHTEPGNVTWSEENAAWASTESLAPGESLDVSVLLGTDREAAEGPYFVSASGFGESMEAAATAVQVNLSGEPVPNETANATTTAAGEAAATTTATETTAAAEQTTMEAMATTTAEESAETTAEMETTTTLPATTDVERNVTATFVVPDGDNVTVTLRVADESEERQRGLMYRQSLADRSGMVFVYDERDPRTFWMKNTYVDLDIIFVAPNGTVLNVEHAQAQPNAPDSEVDRYSSDGQAKYVVELPRGFANETGVGPGTELVFEGPVPEAGPGTATVTTDGDQSEAAGAETTTASG